MTFQSSNSSQRQTFTTGYDTQQGETRRQEDIETPPLDIRDGLTRRGPSTPYRPLASAHNYPTTNMSHGVGSERLTNPHDYPDTGSGTGSENGEDDNRREDDESIGDSHPRTFGHSITPPPPPHPAPPQGQQLTFSDLLSYMQWKDERDNKEAERRHREFMDLQRTLSRDRSDDRLMREEREQERRWKRTPKMPPMKTTEDLELYLHDFAHYMERLTIPPEEWMDNLVPLLPEKYRSVLHTMDPTDRDNFRLVRPFLLESVEREGGSLQYKFAGMVRRRGQPYSEFIGQQMRRWEQFTAGRSMREVGNLLCIELAEGKLPNACRLHVKQQRPTSAIEMAYLVEEFFRDRNSTLDDPCWWQKRGFNPTQSFRGRNDDSSRTHSQPFSKNSDHRQQQDQGGNTGPNDKYNDLKPSPYPRQGGKSYYNKPQVNATECTSCGKRGHTAQQCHSTTVHINLTQPPSAWMVPVVISGKAAMARVDPGADITAIPQEFVAKQNYTGETINTLTATGRRPLPVADDILEIQGETVHARAVVSPSNILPLIGRNVPNFPQLAKAAADQEFAEAKEMHLTTASSEEIQNLQLENADIPSLEEVPRHVEGAYSLESETDNTRESHDDADVYAVQTRAQHRKEILTIAEDDAASAQSGASPMPLAQVKKAPLSPP